MQTQDRGEGISGCALSAIMAENVELSSDELVIRSIANMRECANGLGGSYAAHWMSIAQNLVWTLRSFVRMIS